MQLPELPNGLRWKVCVNTFMDYEDGKNVDEYTEFSNNHLEIPPRTTVIFVAEKEDVWGTLNNKKMYPGDIPWDTFFHIVCGKSYSYAVILAILPHIDKIVIRKSISGISACKDVDILLLIFFLLTCLVKYPCENLPWSIWRVLLGLVFFLIGINFLKRRYHRNRLNFIKRFISVYCCFSLLGSTLFSSIIYIGTKLVLCRPNFKKI